MAFRKSVLQKVVIENTKNGKYWLAQRAINDLIKEYGDVDCKPLEDV